MGKIRVAVSGIAGRMGSRVAALVQKDPELVLAGGLVRDVGYQIFEKNLIVSPRAQEVMGEAEVLVDFTHPVASLEHASAAASMGKAVVIGTTGFTPDQVEKLRVLSLQVPIVLDSNFSLGIAVLKRALVHGLAQAGEAFGCDMVEIHRAGKKDSPSGTAKDLADAVMKATGEKPAITSIRRGEVPGEHILYLTGSHETVELSHRVYSRDAFALGALRAAKWAVKQIPGFYRFADVLDKS